MLYSPKSGSQWHVQHALSGIRKSRIIPRNRLQSRCTMYSLKHWANKNVWTLTRRLAKYFQYAILSSHANSHKRWQDYADLAISLLPMNNFFSSPKMSEHQELGKKSILLQPVWGYYAGISLFLSILIVSF